MLSLYLALQVQRDAVRDICAVISSSLCNMWYTIVDWVRQLHSRFTGRGVPAPIEQDLGYFQPLGDEQIPGYGR